MALDTLERSAPPIFRQGLSATSKMILLGLLAVLLMAADHRMHISQPIRSGVALVLSPLQWLSLQPVNAVNALARYFGNLEEAQDAALIFQTRTIAQAQRLQQVEQLSQENAHLRQLLDLRAIPANLLPKGLVPIQADMLQRNGPVASTQEMTPPPEVLAEMGAANQHHLEPLTDQPQPQDNEIESIIMLAQGMPHLPPEGLSLKDRLAEIERNIIEQALERSQGNVSRTAKLLNLQRTTLIEKINKYELRPA
jgi:hypothetical protein